MQNLLSFEKVVFERTLIDNYVCIEQNLVGILNHSSVKYEIF